MTAQVLDFITVDGQLRELASNPLDPILLATGQRPGFFGFVASSSGNWRGYRCSWIVDGGRLYLMSISGMIIERSPAVDPVPLSTTPATRTRPVTLADLGLTGQIPIHATWFSGELLVVVGKIDGGSLQIFTAFDVAEVRAGTILGWSRRDVPPPSILKPLPARQDPPSVPLAYIPDDGPL